MVDIYYLGHPANCRWLVDSETVADFDHGKEPYWPDLTPHPKCRVTREQYPDPRPCRAFEPTQEDQP